MVVSGALSTSSDRLSAPASSSVSRQVSMNAAGGGSTTIVAATASTSPSSLHTSSEQHDSFEDFDEDVVDAAPMQPIGTCVALYPFDGTFLTIQTQQMKLSNQVSTRVAPDIISGPGQIWPPDMRSDLTIFRCICLTM